jgi:predicted Zn-dependent protease with MMP-like domain
VKPLSTADRFERALSLLDAGREDEGRRELEALARLDPPFAPALLELSALALDAGEDEHDERAVEAGAELARRALEAARAGGLELVPFWEGVLDALIAAPGAFEPAHLRALETDLAGDPLVPLIQGIDAFYRADFPRAKGLLEAARGRDRESALAAHYLGCVLERAGDLDRADAELGAAAALDPSAYAPPFRMSPPDWDAAVTSALAELPPEIAAALDSCVVLAEDFPSGSDVRAGTDPLGLGEFRGRNLGEGSVQDPGTGPSEVVLFRRNLEKIVSSRDDLIEEIRVTLFHEVGHALGFEEDGVDDLGLR